jgi:hypothetical protein
VVYRPDGQAHRVDRHIGWRGAVVEKRYVGYQFAERIVGWLVFDYSIYYIYIARIKRFEG